MLAAGPGPLSGSDHYLEATVRTLPHDPLDRPSHALTPFKSLPSGKALSLLKVNLIRSATPKIMSLDFLIN